MPLLRLYDFNSAMGEKGKSPDYENAIKSGKDKSTTGKEILEYLDHPDRDFDVVVIQNGKTYGQMLTDKDKSSPEVIEARNAYKEAFGKTTDDAMTMKIERPTVFWCPDYKFEFYGDVVGCTMDITGSMKAKTAPELKPGDFYYRTVSTSRLGCKPSDPDKVNIQKIPVVVYTKGFMDPWIVLFHELGHVKQYFEVGEAEWNKKLANTDAIEADNLLRHENPICVQSNIAVRLHYKHMANGMVTINSAYSTGKKQLAMRVANSRPERLLMDNKLKEDASKNKLELMKNPQVEGIFAD